MFSIKLLKLILGVLLCTSKTFGSKLNVPRVLLPVIDTFTVSFNIEVTDDGCYKWLVFFNQFSLMLWPGHNTDIRMFF